MLTIAPGERVVNQHDEARFIHFLLSGSVQFLIRFELAIYVQPEPLIIPVAVANFDKKITRTRLAVIVHPPFRLSQVVPDPHDFDALLAFTRSYQDTYRGYVREAARLASR